jgi:hypothetical protein
VERLAQAQVVEAHVDERLQALQDFLVVGECGDRFGHGELEDVGDVAAVDLHFEHLVAVARAVAVGQRR